MKKILALLIIAMVAINAQGGTVTGQVQNAASGPVRNGVFSFTLTSPATVSGTATVVTSSVPCYTDGNGNVVGEPDPLLTPSLSVNLASGTLPAATYFVKLWYFDGTGNSFVSPEASVTLSAPGTLNVLSPVKQPLNASGFRVGISTTSGSETLQGSVSGVPGAWGNFSQSVALVAGSAMPVSNGTTCTLRFNDELQPSFVCYDVGFSSSTGANIPGFPQFWYLNGGSAGNVNVGSGTPQSNVCQGQGVVYPQAIVTQPPFNATQTVNGGLNVTGNETVGGTLGVIGGVSTPKVNGVTWLDGTTNTTLSGCLATACAAKSTCYVKPNYSEAVAADITVTNDCGLHFTGVAAINLGTHQFKCAGGTCNDFFIDSDIPWGSAGTPSAGVVFTYTGTTTPFSFGDIASDSFSLSLRNFTVNTAGGGAAVSAITLNRVHPFTIQNVRLIGVTGQTGINMIGTGGYTGNGLIENLSANGFTSCVKMTANGNSNRIFASCPNTAAGGKAIDIADGNGNIIYVDAENAPTGINFGNSGNVFGNRVYIYGQGNTTDAVFGAASIANTVDNVGANCTGIVPTVTDSGTNNSFWNPCKFKMDKDGNFTISGKMTTGSAGLSINSGTALVNQTGTGTSVVTNTSPTISGTTTVQRVAAAGTSATSCAVTGAGASGSCSFPVVSTDSYGIMRIAAAGAGPAATGTLTLTLSSSIGTFAVCTFMPSSANTAWNARASTLQTNYSATAPVMSWDNNAVALVAASSYDVTYKCEGH